ncbi:MAG TPA: hypothetical protein VD885_00510 [Methylophilaceae bacterium]|nr:hypothetical protein [Methylophilaceae bacterium]
MGKNRTILALGEAYMSALRECYDDTKPYMRFWIITMMLVLIGLSTLKLR